MAKMGRPTIFDKAQGRRVQGLIGRPGREAFEAARKRLANLVQDLTGWNVAVDSISDSDVIDFLALERQPKELAKEIKRVQNLR